MQRCPSAFALCPHLGVKHARLPTAFKRDADFRAHAPSRACEDAGNSQVGAASQGGRHNKGKRCRRCWCTDADCTMPWRLAKRLRYGRRQMSWHSRLAVGAYFAQIALDQACDKCAAAIGPGDAAARPTQCWSGHSVRKRKTSDA
jgi:hypothetical protein